ncbi:MAG: hypothetical protein R6V32_11260 [Bacteroidales bacterium]
MFHAKGVSRKGAKVFHAEALRRRGGFTQRRRGAKVGFTQRR